MKNNKKILVVGVTGKVGREILSILYNDEKIPFSNVFGAASSKSEGKLINYGSDQIKVQNIEKVDFSKYDIALFSAGSDVSKVYAPIASSNNCIVIDNTSYFRMDDNIPLIVPEINMSQLKNYKDSKIIANPNCSTIQMVMLLKALHDSFILKEVVASTYQSVSGAGQKGIDELLTQTKQILLDNENTNPSHFKKQIAFNVIPQIDSFTDSLYTKEEMKMINETKKILGINDIDITVTCVRVPVIIGHSISVFAKFQNDIDLEKAIKVIGDFNGITINDNIKDYDFATPIESASKNDVFVSRIRKHTTLKNSLTFWCVCDNLRKGAALNAVQIAKNL